MRKYLASAGAVLLLVLAAACTSGDEEGSGDGGGGSPDVPIGPAPGVTDDAIKVGVSYVDLEAIREVANVDHGDYQAAYQALFDGINASGGINGRQIEPVFAPVSPISTQPAEEACVRLTEDEQVFVAVGYFEADAVLCYVETHQTAVVGGVMTPDRLDRAAAPWFTVEPSSDQDADAVRTLADSGDLDGELAVFATVNDEALVNDEVLPLLEELGIEPVDSAVLDAPADDVAAQNQATATIAERFESVGATKVLVVGQGATAWTNGVESLDYRPQLLFTNVNGINTFAGDPARERSLLDGAIAVDRPQVQADVPLDDYENLRPCLDIQRAAGITIEEPIDVGEGEPSQFVSSIAACDRVALLRALLEAAGEDLNYGTFQQAGADLGEVTIPQFPDPFTYGEPPAADGDPVLYIHDWDPDAPATGAVETGSFVVREDQ